MSCLPRAIASSIYIYGEHVMDRELMEEIATYVRQHPRAADTAYGIRMWWLPNGNKVSEERLLSALEYMVSQGMLSRRVLADRQTVYGGVA